MRLAEHPLLRELEVPAWVDEPTAPDLAQLQHLLPPTLGVRLVAPPTDDEAYEARIARCGDIATRPDSWHDAFNAWMWATWPQLKRAFNQRQAADFAIHGRHQRSRAQMAITHVDESGVVVACTDPTLLRAWDAHDWVTLFHTRRNAWTTHLRIWPIGHALLEHLHSAPERLLTAKALVIQTTTPLHELSTAAVDGLLAHAMRSCALLEDPQHPRPLPVSGLPGAWAVQDLDFYLTADCFRPVRPGRVYPAPISWSMTNDTHPVIDTASMHR